MKNFLDLPENLLLYLDNFLAMQDTAQLARVIKKIPAALSSNATFFKMQLPKDIFSNKRRKLLKDFNAALENLNKQNISEAHEAFTEINSQLAVFVKHNELWATLLLAASYLYGYGVENSAKIAGEMLDEAIVLYETSTVENSYIELPLVKMISDYINPETLKPDDSIQAGQTLSIEKYQELEKQRLRDDNYQRFLAEHSKVVLQLYREQYQDCLAITPQIYQYLFGIS